MTPNPTDAPWFWPRAAYIHIPFCAHLCGYCDFAVAVGSDHLTRSYLCALDKEMSAGLAGQHQVDTVFLGGGTPSHLRLPDVEFLLDILEKHLQLSPGAEFTIEANPDSLDIAKLQLLVSRGLTRVSLGAQSFHPDTLKALQRTHDPAAVVQASVRVKELGLGLSLDLIFGVPGQELASWHQDLDQALDLRPDHLSTYGLTYEKGTSLWKQRESGAVHAIGETDELAMYEGAMDRLASAGYEHYEISNFARPGRRSRHNQTYWANHAYLGFGMGAARYVAGRRELNTRSLSEYLCRIDKGQVPTIHSEELDPKERARETMCVQLRRCDGISRSEFALQTGFQLDDIAGAALAQLAEIGVVEDDRQGIRLTRHGKCVADTVAARLLAAET